MRIAGVLTVFEDPEADELSIAYLERGIALANFYASEAIRLQEEAKISSELRKAEQLLLWLRDSWREPCFTIRAIQQNGPNNLRGDKNGIERVIRVLEDHNWIKPVTNVLISGHRARKAWLLRGPPNSSGNA